VFGGSPGGHGERESATVVMLMFQGSHLSVLERFVADCAQTRPTVAVSHPRLAARRRRGGYAGARFGAKFTRLWQNTAMPTAAAKLLNPRYMQIESRNARFKTEIDPSIPARK